MPGKLSASAMSSLLYPYGISLRPARARGVPPACPCHAGIPNGASAPTRCQTPGGRDHPASGNKS
eukprot:5690576-Alexandrium_andersonii.AAC.1